MLKKVLVVYYTQTGQLREIVKAISAPLMKDDQVELFFEELRPKPPFPFPWTSDSFFQAMPESVKGIPCELEPLSLKGDEAFDLIIVAWQPWYLSPSIPAHAFFQHETAKLLMAGRPVISVIGSRNMWVMAHETVKAYVRKAGGLLVGNIVLYDKAPNLLSVISIIRWMFHGLKGRYLKFIPPAGVSDDDIRGSEQYGKIIQQSLLTGDFSKLQSKLVEAGAVEVKTKLIMMEKRGILFFRLWAGFILKKGNYGSPARVGRVRLFKYYLLFVIYMVSPVASLVYQIIKPFRSKTIKKQISLYQSNG